MNLITPKLNMLDARLARENAEIALRKSKYGNYDTLGKIAKESEQHNFDLALGQSADMARNNAIRHAAAVTDWSDDLSVRAYPIAKPIVARGATPTAESYLAYSMITHKLNAKLSGLELGQCVDVLADMFGGNYTDAAILNDELTRAQSTRLCHVKTPALLNAMAEHNFSNYARAKFAAIEPTHTATAVHNLLHAK